MDEKKKISGEEFIEAVCTKVRFTPAREKIAEELRAHLEDRAAMLMEHGVAPEDAAVRAAASMGDPAEIGAALDREHSPFWGWAAVWTDVARYLALFVAAISLVLVLTGPGLSGVLCRSEVTYSWDPPIETNLMTVPLWEWHSTGHFFVFFSRAEFYTGARALTGRPEDTTGPWVRIYYTQWQRNPFLRSEQYVTCRTMWDENGTQYESGFLDGAKPETLYCAFEAPYGEGFTLEIPLNWEEVEWDAE